MPNEKGEILTFLEAEGGDDFEIKTTQFEEFF
jgi:hypothetical protein